jgi:hypothetical protein
MLSRTAYRLHDSGSTLNPDSYFLRYPANPDARIIALPAHIGGEVQKSGIKWISSFPGKPGHQLSPRVRSPYFERCLDWLSTRLSGGLVD